MSRGADGESGEPAEMPGAWSLLTAHGRALAVIIADPHARPAEVAAAAGLPEDRAEVIVADLEQAGYLTRAQPGEAHRHTVHFDKLGTLDGLNGRDLRQVLRALKSVPPAV